MGKYELPEEHGRVDVIAGSYKGVAGPASTFTPMQVYNIYLKRMLEFHSIYPTNFNIKDK
jgi:redox-sensitive bicupin YhaK (pirin superfamily)